MSILISEGTAFLAEETANARAWRLGEALHVEGIAEARVRDGSRGSRRRDERSDRNAYPIGTYRPL